MFQFNDCEVYITYFHVPNKLNDELFDNYHDVNNDGEDNEEFVDE